MSQRLPPPPPPPMPMIGAGGDGGSLPSDHALYHELSASFGPGRALAASRPSEKRTPTSRLISSDGCGGGNRTGSGSCFFRLPTRSVNPVVSATQSGLTTTASALDPSLCCMGTAAPRPSSADDIHGRRDNGATRGARA